MTHFYQALRLLLLFICGLPLINATAQDATLQGTVTDASTREAIGFATVATTKGSKMAGVQTDFNGQYTLTLPAGSYTVSITYVGYTTLNQDVSLEAGQTLNLDIALKEEQQILETVVVSEGKFAKKLGEQTLSVSVIKPSFIESINAPTIDAAIEKTPGVDVIDGQANIRGGSGFSYGAGSRVMLLMDDMPILTPDLGYADWDFLPIENLEQIEILKGSASVLYGSSALNGVINLRTAYPKSEPETKFSWFTTGYQNPANNMVVKYLRSDETFSTPVDTAYKAWWGNRLLFESGATFAHKQKFGQLDLVAGAAVYAGDSWRESLYSRRGRVNANLRYRFKQIPGLSVGVNTNLQQQSSGTFLIWNNFNKGDTIAQNGVDEGAYTYWDLTAPVINQNFSMTIDPFIEYFSTSSGIKHKLMARFYKNNNQTTAQRSTFTDYYYGEYQFQKRFENIRLVLTAGGVGMKAIADAELYGGGGIFKSSNVAAYLQADKKFFNRLNLSFGARWERNQIGDESEARPVFRAGMNYEATPGTFVRASYGQGYRFPTISEKYLRTGFGAYKVNDFLIIDIGVYPNPALRSESGWNAEVGVKQGIKIGEWSGFLDIAGFVNEYENMMEFTFGFSPTLYQTVQSPAIQAIIAETSPQLAAFLSDSCAFEANVNIPDDGTLGAGFQSVNIGNTRIIGAEISFAGQGKLFGYPTNTFIGYTRITPTFKDFNCVQQALSSSDENILKYRFRHTVKSDIETTVKQFKVGLTFQYYSFMEAIDQAFTILLPGVADFRNNHNNGDFIIDARLGFNLSQSSQISFLVKNLLNREYMLRPGIIEAPRNFTLRYAWTLKGKEKS